MRRDVLQLRSFYATALGRAVRDILVRKLVEAWGEARGLDVLGVGYATPYMEPFCAEGRRTVASMLRFRAWSAGRTTAPTRSACRGAPNSPCPSPTPCSTGCWRSTPWRRAKIPAALLTEVKRVLAPSGRLILVVASRRGMWSHTETTPFGYGRPFSRAQLEGGGARRRAGADGLVPGAISPCRLAARRARWPSPSSRWAPGSGRHGRADPDGSRETDLRGQASRSGRPRAGAAPGLGARPVGARIGRTPC